MKKKAYNLLLLLLLQWLVTTTLKAQIFSTLHSFTNSPDGGRPYDAPTISGNVCYGTTVIGGLGWGTVFRMNLDGTGLMNLHNFSQPTSGAFTDTNSDGYEPTVTLLLSSNVLYGTMMFGGLYGSGTVFRMNTDGSGFTTLYVFSPYYQGRTYLGTNSDGIQPEAGLVQSGPTLYGTASSGGLSGDGTIFAINSDGSGFTNFFNFSGANGNGPIGNLVLSGNTLYGVTAQGGPSNDGILFRINTNGTAFVNLHSFLGADGKLPQGGLALSGNTLYGTAAYGGSANNGTVFRVNIDGTGFANLHNFSATTDIGGTSTPTNSDGMRPFSTLFLSGNTLYGTASAGGLAGNGTVFSINTGGTAFNTLHSFSADAHSTNIDGAVLNASVVLSSNSLYGAATGGGVYSNGTIFRLVLPGPQLGMEISAPYAVLAWPTNTYFYLESTTNLVPPVAWSTNPTIPVTVGGQNVITDTVSGSRKYYRLISQ